MMEYETETKNIVYLFSIHHNHGNNQLEWLNKADLFQKLGERLGQWDRAEVFEAGKHLYNIDINEPF